MKNIALYTNLDKKDAAYWAEQTIIILNKLGAECSVEQKLYDIIAEENRSKVQIIKFSEIEKHADVIITFGGDGTILSAARTIVHKNIPIMGFNIGKLGFLAEFSVDELNKHLEDLLQGNYRLVDRVLLETKVDSVIYYALNDFVIEKSQSSRMITVQTYSDEHFVGEYKVDGLVLATPTGSTAYSLSSGGPIIAPSSPVLCLTPICPHTLNIRPLVLPDTNELKFIIRQRSKDVGAVLVADGRIIKKLYDMESVSIKKSDARIKLVKPIDSAYYDLLREKLFWAVTFKNNNLTS